MAGELLQKRQEVYQSSFLITANQAQGTNHLRPYGSLLILSPTPNLIRLQVDPFRTQRGTLKGARKGTLSILATEILSANPSSAGRIKLLEEARGILRIQASFLLLRVKV